MKTSTRLLLGTTLTLGASFGARTAQAQVDVNPPPPNVMLLVDSSGSMEYKSSSANFPACDPNTSGTSEKSRWVELIEVLTGSVVDYRCQAIDRSSSSFLNEYILPGSVNPPDYNYLNPFHRAMNGTCVVGPGTLTADAYDLSAASFNEHVWNASGTPCNFTQLEDGLLDDGAFRKAVRFGLMTFDTSPDPGKGVAVLPSKTPNYTTGVDGTWSYFLNQKSGRPAGCAVDQPQEVGARNAAAPPWEGRMVAFGTPTSAPETRNDMIQKILVATRPYGATPIAGMMDDVRDFLWNDNTKDPTDATGTADFGPKDDPFVSGGCRKNFVILLTDGEPNLDLRPYCEGAGGSCPYQKPEAISWDLANASDPDDRVNTFVIGFAVSNVTLASATNVDCEALTVADLNSPTGLCATNPAEQALQACCTLNRIAYNGGTGRAFFANDKDELRAALAGILSGLTANTSSRTIPVFASVPSGGSGGIADGFRFFSSFEPAKFTLWKGVIERERFVCKTDTSTSTLFPEPQAIDPTKGDDFVANVNSGAGPARVFWSVNPTISGAVAYSPRSVRPKVTSNVDGVGVYSGTQYQGDKESFSAGTNPESMAIDGTTCTGLTAGPCRDRYIRWLTGADTTSAYSRCPTPGAASCSLVGDIFHSTPRIVTGQPSEFLRDESYEIFSLKNAKRHTVMYTSTNDGFLHAFKVSSGDPATDPNKVDSKENNELWAFVPPAVLPAIKSEYPPAHQTLLDGVPVVQDVVAVENPAGTGNYKFERSPADARLGLGTWRTILVQAFGGRRGGYFAVDVTDPVPGPDASDPKKGPRFLWQLTQDASGAPLFGNGGATPLITTLFFDTGAGELKEVAVAVLPGGEDPDGPTGNSVTRKDSTPDNVDSAFPARGNINEYGTGLGNGGARSLTIVRLDSGEIIRTFRASNTLAPPAVDAAGRVIVADIDSPITGTPVAFPGSTGSIADRLFVGDADGTFWRVDVSKTDPDDWTMKLFFDGFSGRQFDDGQPIQTPPVLSVDLLGNVTIAFSTGEQDALIGKNGIDNFVWSLTEKLNAAKTAFESKANWFVELEDSERVTGPMTLFNGALFFSSYKPENESSTDVCGTGSSRVWGMDYILPKTTGAPADGGKERLPDENSVLQQFIDNTSTLLTDGSIIFGVGVTQLPSCADETTSADPYFGGTATHTRLTNIQPGRFELVMHTGTVGSTVAGGQTNRLVIQLPAPAATARIDSWAAIVE
jgi:type IV pilus assembly protein PilY1